MIMSPKMEKITVMLMIPNLMQIKSLFTHSAESKI